MPRSKLKTHDGLPAVKDAEGKDMSEFSITVTDKRLNGGKPTNIPSLWNGEVVSEDDAVENALKTGKQYKAFDSIKDAVDDAIRRSDAGGANAPVNYARGGNVEQMKKLFAEGGMMDDSGEQVNGVEVPPGSLREEVADDIPAQLSEGEFVVPADVVRYIGLEKLMAIRDKAKQGLKRMEEMGQMGNAEEVSNPDQTFSEQDDSDFEAEIDDIMQEGNNYAVGGIVTPENVDKMGWARNPTVDVRYFKHPDGRVMFITYINGRPQTAIPDGFVQTDEPVEKLVGKKAEEKAGAGGAPAPTGGGDSGGGIPTDSGDTSTADGKQGISNRGIDIGLKVLGATEGVLGKTVIGAVARKAAESYLDKQIDALDTAGEKLGRASTPDAFGLTGVGQTGMFTRSDENGNVQTVSNKASIEAQNRAIFGVSDVDDEGGTGRSDTGTTGPGSTAPVATRSMSPAPAPSSNPNVYSRSPSSGESSGGGGGGDSGGGGGGGGGNDSAGQASSNNGTHICTASYNLSLITPTHFKSLKQYGIGLRKKDPYLMRAYDSFGPALASYVGKSSMSNKAAKFLTEYYKTVQTQGELSTTQKIFSVVSNYALRPTYRIIGWILTKVVDKK